MLETIESLGIVKKMEAFDDAHAANPMFRVMRHYMCMVVEMLAFIKSVRTGDSVSYTHLTLPTSDLV